LPVDALVPYTLNNPGAGLLRGGTGYGPDDAAYRSAESGPKELRFANFMLPFWTQTPQGKFTEHLHNRAWVPMDDTHTMFVSLMWRRHPPSIGPNKRGEMMPGFKRVFDYLPNDSDWPGRWRLQGRAVN